MDEDHFIQTCYYRNLNVYQSISHVYSLLSDSTSSSQPPRRYPSHVGVTIRHGMIRAPLYMHRLHHVGGKSSYPRSVTIDLKICLCGFAFAVRHSFWACNLLHFFIPNKCQKGFPKGVRTYPDWERRIPVGAVGWSHY